MSQVKIIDSLKSVSRFKQAAENALYRKVGNTINNIKIGVAKEIIARPKD